MVCALFSANSESSPLIVKCHSTRVRLTRHTIKLGERNTKTQIVTYLFFQKKKKVATILARKYPCIWSFFPLFFPSTYEKKKKKKLFKFTQNGIYTVSTSAASFKCITFQVTRKHFFEICLNLSFSVTMKLPGSSACDMTELGCSWPTAIIIRCCCWEKGSGWANILEGNHTALCTGEVTPWNWIVPSPRDLSSVSLWYKTRTVQTPLSPWCQPPI